MLFGLCTTYDLTLRWSSLAPHFAAPFRSFALFKVTLGHSTPFPSNLSITQSKTLDLTFSHRVKLRNLTLLIEFTPALIPHLTSPLIP